jgi:hypothetical protein
MLTAEKERDTAFFSRLEADRFRFTGWQGELLTREEDLASVAATGPRAVDSSRVDLVAVERQGSVAVVWGRTSIAGRVAGGVAQRSGSAFTHLFVWHLGSWQLVAAHASPAPGLTAEGTRKTGAPGPASGSAASHRPCPG